MALERPETPQSSGLRKTFDQIRPDTMESKFNGESPRSEEVIDDKVEIGKFKSLFILNTFSKIYYNFLCVLS